MLLADRPNYLDVVTRQPKKRQLRHKGVLFSRYMNADFLVGTTATEGVFPPRKKWPPPEYPRNAIKFWKTHRVLFVNVSRYRVLNHFHGAICKLDAPNMPSAESILTPRIYRLREKTRINVRPIQYSCTAKCISVSDIRGVLTFQTCRPVRITRNKSVEYLTGTNLFPLWP